MAGDPGLDEGLYYDAHYETHVEDLPFYLGHAKASPGPILEVACGTGRLTLEIARMGKEVVGADISEAMLKRAREKAAVEGLKIEWVLCDCRELSLGRKFDLVLMPFNSFPCLLDLDSVHRFLQRLKPHLRDRSSTFVFDTSNPSRKFLAGARGQRRLIQTFKDPQTGEDIQVEAAPHYEESAGIIRSSFYYSKPGRKDFLVRSMDRKVTSPDELDAILAANGFEVESRLGDFQGKPFTGESTKQVLVCRLSGA